MHGRAKVLNARIVAIAVVGCVACATLELPEYPVHAPGEYANTVARSGLVLAVEPIVDGATSQRYFGTDLGDANIVPVLVVAENRSTASFLLDKNQIELLTPKPALEEAVSEGGAEAAMTASVAALGVGMVAFLPLAVAAIPAMFAVGKELSDLSATEHQLLTSELQSTTLSPGKRAHGFVYFQLPADRELAQLGLTVPFVDLERQRTERFEFRFRWERGT